MYHTAERHRHWRAVKAQAWGIPLVFWWGPLGPLSNVPFAAGENVSVVTFDPFPASRYGLDQVAQAHADYLVYLKACFDSRKAEMGCGHKELVFVGRHGPLQPTHSRL